MDKPFKLKDGLHVSGNAAVVGSITTVDSVQFNLTHNVTNEIGMLDWSVDNNTLEMALSPNVTLQVGQEQLYLVKNQTGVDIADGSAVMAVGTLGASGRILVAPAIANGSISSKYVIGLTTETIANGNDGFVTSFGKVRGLDTSMWSEGDVLYVSSSTPGGLSNTQPVAPNNKITMAIVVNKSDTNGTVFVRPTFGSAISEDENVHISDVSDGQTLVWSSANNRFENKTVSGGSGGNAFSIIEIPGQSNVVAESGADTFTLTSSNNIILTSNVDTITIGVDMSAYVLSNAGIFTGNVGINTSTPTSALHIVGDTTLSGSIIEKVYSIVDAEAFEIDPGNGSVQLITLGASRTPKATNFAAGESITLMVNDGSAYTVTWTDATFGGSGVVWKTDGGVAPTLNTTEYTVIVLWKVGTQVYGARVGDA